MAQLDKLNWENKMTKEWNAICKEKNGYDTDIKPLLIACAKIATDDVDKLNSYTELVMKNLNIIVNKEGMTVTFKQWVSLKLYYNNYKKTQLLINPNNLSKLINS